MTLTEYYQQNQGRTDKGSTHSYVCWFYNGEFTARKDDPVWLVEIGVETGDSLELWAGWFKNGKIWGVDHEDRGYRFAHRNINFIHSDAYCPNAADRFNDETLDYVIDDGPHTIESQIACVKLWMPKLKPEGRMIIEDVQDIDAARVEFDKLSIPYVVIDMRRNKGRNDDVLFCITK